MTGDFYQAFRDHAQTLAPLTALVGTRVHARKYPQSPTYPAILVTRIGLPDVDMTLTGASGISTETYQIEVADSEENAANGEPLVTALAIAKILSSKPAAGFLGFTGLLGTSPNQVQIGVMLLVNQFDTYDAAELRVLRVIQTWRVQMCE